MGYENLIQALKKKGYQVSFFTAKEEAAQYLKEAMQGKEIGFGDSETMSQMNLYQLLSENNTVYDPKQWVENDDFLETAKKCLTTDIFMTSVNGMTEDGIIINLDGTGNRVAGSLFGHKKVYYILGRNKIAPDIDKALWRVRNIAAPRNAKRLKTKTPCAIKGERCFDCNSPERICNALLIEYRKMNDMDMEIVLIDEELGF